MISRLCCLAFVLFVVEISSTPATAQQISIGPNGVQYNGYGRGYYGGYGPGANYYGPRVRTYSGYGNGPYGYGARPYAFPSAGAGSSYQFPSNGYYNNGYYTTGTYGQYYAPVYSPYGFSINAF